MKLKSLKRIFSAAFWPALAISALAAVEPVYAVTPLSFLQSQTAPTYRPGNTMLRLTRCGWPYLGNGDNKQLDLDTQKELAGRWGYALKFSDTAGDLRGGAVWDDANSFDRALIDFAKNNPGYETFVWEPRQLPTFAESPSCYLRRADGSAITDVVNGNPIWSPAAPDSELLNFSQRRLDYLNKGRQYGPITYIGNMGEYALDTLSRHTDGDMINYCSQDPTVMAAKGSSEWWNYISSAKAHQEIVMHSKLASGIGELKHYFWYPNGGSFDRNRYGWWTNWTWGYEWMRNITLYPSEQFYLGDSNGGFTGPDDVLTKELNATGCQIRYGHPLAYTWVESARNLNGDSSAERRWIGCLKALYTLGTLGVNVGGYVQTSPLNQPDVDPANPPFWMRDIINASRVQGLFSYLEPFLRRSDLLPGPNMHIYAGVNPAYEFPVANDSTARVVARKMTDANRWLITAWAMGGGDRSVSVTIPVLGTVTLLARDVGSVYHYANGTLTQLDSSDGTLVTLDTATLNAQLGDLYSATATSSAADDATFVSQSVPTSMFVGQQYAVSVTMKNNGTATWISGGATPYYLGSQNPQDNNTWGLGGLGRVAVPGSISRGNLTTFNFTVTAPSTPGVYNFQYQMVHHGVTWFGAQTTNVPVSVNSPATFSSTSFTSDADSGISTANTYTAKADFAGPGTRSINGVLFSDTGLSGTNYTLTGATNTYTGSSTNVSGQVGAGTTDFLYSSSNTETLTLTGLTVGQQYLTTFYNIGWGSRPQNITATSFTGTFVYDENENGTYNGSKLMYRFTATATSEAITFSAQTAGNSEHQYLFTNQQVTAGSTFSSTPFTGDADSGISTANTYTAKADFAGTGSRSINGVLFSDTGTSGANYTLTGITNTYTGSSTNVSGQVGASTTDFLFSTSGTETLTLTGLTVGQQYLTTFYNIGWGSRPQNITATSYTGTFVYDENENGTYNGSKLMYQFVATATSEAITFSAQTAGNSEHQYLFTNQQLAAASPSMAVSGSGVISDNTGVYDYGAMATGSFLDHTFTITNNGTSALNLTGTPIVTISGTNAADFSVTAQPASSSVAAGGSITFTVRFTPGAAGARTARVNIANNDPAKSPYDFALNGTGLAAPTYQAAGTAVNGLGTITPAWPAHQSGDVALLMVETANQAVSLSTPAGFVEVTNSPQGAGTAGGTAATRLAVYWKRATSSAEASPTVADSGDHQIAQIITFRGCASSGNPWDITAGGVATTASTAVSIPGATTTVGNTLVATIVANGTDTATAQTSAWANAGLTGLVERIDSNTSTGNGGGFGVATGVKTAAGAYAATTATLATSSVQGRLSIALKP